jgi:heme exporter protein C
MTQALAFLYNPHRFMAFSAWAAPLFGALALALAAAGLWLGFTAPEDYQQGDTVRIMFIHVPAAWLGLFVYVCLGGASFLSLVFRQALADAAARAAAPIGAVFTALALATGSLWGKPMWRLVGVGRKADQRPCPLPLLPRLHGPEGLDRR